MFKMSAVAFMFVALTVFWIGFHSVDLAYNMDSGCIDWNGSIYQTRNDMYINGNKLMFNSMFWWFMAVIVLFIPNPRVKKTLNSKGYN